MKYFLYPLLVLFALGCSKSSISDRDAKREALLSAAAVKRQELMMVSGNYNGKLVQTSNNATNEIALVLGVKDVAVPVDGTADTIPTPYLTGYLKLILGSGPADFVTYTVEKGDFDPRQAKLDLIVGNKEQGEIVMTAWLANSVLTGNWTSASAAASGILEVKKQ